VVKRKTPSVSEEDTRLFRNAVDQVRRLPEIPSPPAPEPLQPHVSMANADEAQTRSEFVSLLRANRIEAGDILSWRQASVPTHLLRRLGRGDYAIQDELDLHGCQAEQAERLLRRFLGKTIHAQHGCVRIIHGKGLGSGTNVPVLKNLVDRILRQRANVLAFHSAPPAQGGTGAVLVLLRNGRSQR